MSISGNLEDVSVADVLQFIHLGASTGTLTLTQRRFRAEITFHRGRIINAWTPESRRLGELLVSQGLLSRLNLKKALYLQKHVWPRKSLGQVLTAAKAVNLDQIHRAVTGQIERTIFKVMAWRDGEFKFSRDQLKPIDELGMYPGDLLANIRLNTEHLLLRGAQMWDEGDEGGGEGEDIKQANGDPESKPPKKFDGDDTAFTLADVAEFTEAVLSEPEGPKLSPSDVIGEVEPDGRIRPRLQVVSTDVEFVDQLRACLPNENGHLGQIELRDAGSSLPGEPAPVVLVDLRSPEFDFSTIQTVRRLRPRATVVAMIEDVMMTGKSYEAGAVAAVPGDPQAAASCLLSLVRDRGFASFRSEVEQEARSSFNRLRRIVADLRSGVISATMALNLMHILSEAVERAILFLARKDSLVSLGAFGFGSDARPLAELCGGIRITLGTDCALAEAVRTGSASSLTFEEVKLPPEMQMKVGHPLFDQTVVLPIVGTERVIGVIYADNGDANRPVEDVEMLELAAAQVGIAFENELLRRKIGKV